jgi:hypothetical protein
MSDLDNLIITHPDDGVTAFHLPYRNSGYRRGGILTNTILRIEAGKEISADVVEKALLAAIRFGRSHWGYGMESLPIEPGDKEGYLEEVTDNDSRVILAVIEEFRSREEFMRTQSRSVVADARADAYKEAINHLLTKLSPDIYREFIREERGDRGCQ